jgi:hypothetical protein
MLGHQIFINWLTSNDFKVRGSWSKKVGFHRGFHEILIFFETTTSQDLKSLRKSTFFSLFLVFVDLPKLDKGKDVKKSIISSSLGDF